ncbi:predicted protein [Naegleria gruberi]|uniref:Predicted protein n=1 Tax=Naegleria gruberi TaxID=5762 RepID=D2VZL7_NAEGR|nr:uncharacterized protein NAEGRDRAFT_81837 [Naegleria gruberi]EFC37722.1 predicted protein [Naegleria gruberi]|eukprot:XP_002670466.1 predicted protein [Naegleria gruberi strain NEG-M]
MESPLSSCSSTSSSVTCSSMMLANESMDREWQMIHMDEQAIKNDMLLNIAKVTFLISSRTDPDIDFVPEKLYSSLKYKFKIDVETCGNSSFSESQILLADIDIIDSQGSSLLGSKNGEQSGKKKELLKGVTHLSLEEKKRKPIIAKKRLNRKDEKDLSDSEICTGKSRTLSCTSKFQFSEVAYHHQKEFVNFKVSLYSLEGYSGKTPLLCMVSAAFQIYGRRTTEQRDEEVRKKRQYMEMKQHLLSTSNQECEQPIMSLKKVKLDNTSNDQEDLLQTYEKELQNLLHIFKALSPEEQLEAYNKTVVSLLDIPQDIANQTEPASSVFSDPFVEEACDCMYWLTDDNCPNCAHHNTNNNDQFDTLFGNEEFLSEEDFKLSDCCGNFAPSKSTDCNNPPHDFEIDLFNQNAFSADESELCFF